MGLFIRDDIRVRDLDKRYKQRMRIVAARSGEQIFGGHSYRGGNFRRWQYVALTQKVTVKGA